MKKIRNAAPTMMTGMAAIMPFCTAAIGGSIPNLPRGTASLLTTSVRRSIKLYFGVSLISFPFLLEVSAAGKLIGYVSLTSLYDEL